VLETYAAWSRGPCTVSLLRVGGGVGGGGLRTPSGSPLIPAHLPPSTLSTWPTTSLPCGKAAAGSSTKPSASCDSLRDGKPIGQKGADLITWGGQGGGAAGGARGSGPAAAAHAVQRCGRRTPCAGASAAASPSLPGAPSRTAAGGSKQRQRQQMRQGSPYAGV
jgi:hypothetical protein